MKLLPVILALLLVGCTKGAVQVDIHLEEVNGVTISQGNKAE